MNSVKELNCPACGNNLKKFTIDNVMIDVCQDGCGGIWFDNYEFKKFDEKNETDIEQLLKINKNPNIQIDVAKRRKCPTCPNSVLLTHFSSVKQKVLIEECPTCRGIWLDMGELTSIRNEYENQEQSHEDAVKTFKNQYTKLMAAKNELYDEENINKRLSDDQQRAILSDNNLTREEMEMLVKDEESDLYNLFEKKLDDFEKKHPNLFFPPTLRKFLRGFAFSDQ